VAQGLPDKLTGPWPINHGPTAATMGPVRPTDEEFRAAWPRVVRVLASWSGSLDDAEEYAAEAMARALDEDDIGDLAAWCVSVAKRAWIDDHRRRGVFARLAPELVTGEAMPVQRPPDEVPEELDDRVALLFVACDEALAPGARMVLALRVVCGLTIAQAAMHLGIQESAAAARLTRAKRALSQARGEFRVPDAGERRQRLPDVLDCVAGMFTVAHRTGLEPPDALADMGAQALSIVDALVALFPDETEVRGLRAVVRLGLARRPGRVDADGAALTLDEVDRSTWDQRLLRAGVSDAAAAARGNGRFALEAAISGLHSVAPSFARTDWPRIVQLYTALQQVWPSPAVDVALLAAQGQLALAGSGDLGAVEQGLQRLADEGPSYARRDAAFALADLCWRTGRRDEAAERYRELAGQAHVDAVRRFCLRRAGALG
jgi:predicted RNA polymerase sigma factor